MLRSFALRCRTSSKKCFTLPIGVVTARPSLYRSCLATRTLPCLPQLPLRSYSTTTTITATHCPGCGAAFQQTQADQPGYLVTTSPTPTKKRKPSSGLDHATYASLVEGLDPATRALLEGTEVTDDITQPEVTSTSSRPTSTPICQRCHQLTHHSRTNEPGNAAFLRSSQQYSSLVSFLRTKRQPLLIYVMDVTDMPWSIDGLQQLTEGGTRVIVVANKVDLLPSHAIKHHDQRIRDAITMNIKQIIGSTSSIEAVQLVSAKKGWGIKTLLKRIQHHLLPTDDVYVVGSVNAGKSALMNQLLNHARSLQKHQYRPTTSAVPGTTLGLVRIPLHIFGLQPPPTNGRGVARDHFLIDTPGLIMPSSLVAPQKKPSPIHPMTFRLRAQQSLVLGHARIDVLESQYPILMTLFTPTLSPHITKTDKLLQDSTHIMVRPKIDVVSHPQRSSQAVMDLAFAGGIGWIALTGDFGRASLRVWLDPSLPSSAFAIREPSFLPFEFRGQVRKFFGSGDRAMQ